MNPHLGNTFTDSFAIAKITQLSTVNAHLDPRFDATIAQRGKPMLKYRRCLNSFH
ncbi:hypothetical protein CPter291_3428 [Collimonas pratensis]|uniref:Uncharacterized protein n=1 Tax=Collimonas pratensis TaxID=279113 RepID=A0ABN4MBP1_9BURK|nr:hypothetical protein CPter291_3428 [Collimonas pratensis]